MRRRAGFARFLIGNVPNSSQNSEIMGRFVIEKGRSGAYRFNLRAGNGEVILTSESYTSLAACRRGVASVRANAAADERYERKEARDGSAYFTLKAGNGRVIGVSETYSSAAARERGIASVKRNAPVAEITEPVEA